jgi:hypothetical protein
MRAARHRRPLNRRAPAAPPPDRRARVEQTPTQGCFDWTPEREIVFGPPRRSMTVMERLRALYGRE